MIPRFPVRRAAGHQPPRRIAADRILAVHGRIRSVSPAVWCFFAVRARAGTRQHAHRLAGSAPDGGQSWPLGGSRRTQSTAGAARRPQSGRVVAHRWERLPWQQAGTGGAQRARLQTAAQPQGCRLLGRCRLPQAARQQAAQAQMAAALQAAGPAGGRAAARVAPRPGAAVVQRLARPAVVQRLVRAAAAARAAGELPAAVAQVPVPQLLPAPPAPARQPAQPLVLPPPQAQPVPQQAAPLPCCCQRAAPATQNTAWPRLSPCKAAPCAAASPAQRCDGIGTARQHGPHA